MSADLLRAAVAIEEDYSAEAIGMPAPDPFMYAVAGWLSDVAQRVDGMNNPTCCDESYDNAVEVARAYLGEA